MPQKGGRLGKDIYGRLHGPPQPEQETWNDDDTLTLEQEQQHELKNETEVTLQELAHTENDKHKTPRTGNQIRQRQVTLHHQEEA